MFLGHQAFAFGAKRVSPGVSLGTLILASQFIDLLWPLLLLLGLEHVRFAPGITAFSPFDFYDYPISHSLLTVIIWGACLGGLYYAIRRSPRGAWVVAACVVSHWVLDFVAHRPDLPLIPGVANVVGLGLWNSVVGTVVVEGGMFVAGVFLYVRSTRAADHVGTYALWALVALLIVIYVGSMSTRDPVTQEELGIGGLTQWLLVPWGYWIDRHRRAASP